MGAKGVKKPHAVCIPLPAQGHINTLLKVAKLLHSKGFHITFVHFDFTYNQILATGGGSSVLQGTDGFRFEVLACDGLSSLADVILKDGSPAKAVAFRELLKTLMTDSSTSVPVPTCIVSDSYLTFTLEVAAEFAIPDMLHIPCSASVAMSILHFKEMEERGLVPLKGEEDLKNGYLDTPVDWIPGMINTLRLRDICVQVRTTRADDVVFNYLKKESQAAVAGDGFIINTFDELESQVLDALSSFLSPIYTIGPLPLLSARMLDEIKPSSLWKEDAGCLKWLDGRAHGSVVYVSFGTTTDMTEEQLMEVAWGLSNSGYDFLWVIRPRMVGGGGTAVLPKEFLDETRERGLVSDWCPQEEVLKHPSVGVFVTHGGWNSVMESISAGVPIACWSCVTDTPTYSRYACTEWGIGMRIDDDIKREEVERVIKDMMESEKGKEMKNKALKWKEAAHKATRPGGRSFMNLDKLVRDLSD